MYSSDICIFASLYVCMRLSRRFKYIFRILVWGCLALYISTWTLLNLPYVQGKLAALASGALKQVLNTEVSVGRVNIGMLNRIIIEDVLLNDQQGEEMLKVSRLAARFELKPLFDGKTSINHVQLFGLSAQLKRDTPQATPNFQFVLDALA